MVFNYSKLCSVIHRECNFYILYVAKTTISNRIDIFFLVLAIIGNQKFSNHLYGVISFNYCRRGNLFLEPSPIRSL